MPLHGVMVKKIIKLFLAVFAFWTLFLLVFIREFKMAKIIVNRKSYGQAVRQYKMLNGQNIMSAFREWRALPPVDGSISENEKRRIVKSIEDPPGAYGKPVVLATGLNHQIKSLVEIGWADHAFNQFVSDLIPVERSLPDQRDDWCKTQKYSIDLPKVTVIICFHNEAWSTLIRTINSVLDRTPQNLLEKIILVDDYSRFNDLKRPLDKFVNRTPKVSIIRTSSRIGLIAARILPIKDIKSPVIVYLDSHCECTTGWLQPLLQRIKENRTRVVSPVVDHIHANTFEYIKQKTHDLRLGGFSWDLRFTWIGIPQKIYRKRLLKNELAAPINTPTISGGMFAIDKEYFKEIGYYDLDMEIWGAENLELSFKTWMCGGSLEIVPCSHVGHIFRKRIPYKKPHMSFKKNYVRLAEVWLDNYAEFYYNRIGYHLGEFGNVDERIKLRKDLKCKSFQWYLDNVYPQHEVPSNNAASGQIYTANEMNLCFDAVSRMWTDVEEEVNLLPCHFQGGNQFWTYSTTGEIRRDEYCLDLVLQKLILNLCDNGLSQIWLYDDKNQEIKHFETGLCLNTGVFLNSYKLALTDCMGSDTQKFEMENFNHHKLSPELVLRMKSVAKTTDH